MSDEQRWYRLSYKLPGEVAWQHTGYPSKQEWEDARREYKAKGYEVYPPKPVPPLVRQL